MRAKAWNNGVHHPTGSGYGIKIAAADRDRYFHVEWKEIRLEVPHQGQVTIALSSSFWRDCTELRHQAIGRWLRSAGFAPWPRGAPPTLELTPVAGAVFRLDPGHDNSR